MGDRRKKRIGKKLARNEILFYSYSKSMHIFKIFGFKKQYIHTFFMHNKYLGLYVVRLYNCLT